MDKQTENKYLAEVQNVTYTHWNQKTPTLHDVSLQIQPGTLNVLVGPSGSGKSTLCALFNGVIPHLFGGELEGQVIVDGLNTREIEVKIMASHVGLVFQDPEIMFAMLYVDDEIAFGPENLRLDAEDIRKTVEELLVQTDLVERRNNLVWNLSGGQIQKLGLAAVLAMHPKMIVLDEPTANLDPVATRDVHELVLELRDQGVTVLYVTRELDDFLAEADQLIVMDKGKIVAADHPQAVLKEKGYYLAASLGVWLPETCEIGIALQRAGKLGDGTIPIRVDDTITLLEKSGVLNGNYQTVATTGEQENASAESDETEVLVSAKNLRFTYPGGVEALKGISMEIHAGEWLMIVGRNGAGKSTLASMLVGLTKPEDDALQLFGKDARKWKVQDLANQIGLVFQNPEHQFLTDTVEDEIGYSLLAQGITEPYEVKKRTDEMLELLGLNEVKSIHPFALSAGLKRRLGVATMLVGNPKILLVDEPTYGQDKEMTFTLMALMKEINARGVAIVMITHDMRLVQEYADRVVVMSNGEILFDGLSSGLFEQDEVLEKANLRRTLLHDIVTELDQRGVKVDENVRSTADLIHFLNLSQE